MLLMLSFYETKGQVAISANGSSPDNSAMLDVQSTNRGILLPRMTKEQIESIQNPANGLIVYCITNDKFYAYTSRAKYWKEISFGSEVITPFFNCGDSLWIDHIAGDVAPESETITYGTVANIPGEPTKCWITSNLGANHQADSINDPSEAAAGWYWQFNLKQGYKCSAGSNIYPLWTILSLNENSNWALPNDPCNLELGGSWRIPTYTEWFNIDAVGLWTNWNGPWNSALKLHTAGTIQTEGYLFYRGLHGSYWSSTEKNSSMGYNIFFIDALCQLVNDYKTMGATIRCLRE
jgi:hypothetical protein